MNRVLFPYMNEALVLLAEGAPMDAIDKAAEKFGMPMGPIALEDFVGLDTAAYAGKVLLDAYPDRAVSTPLLLVELVEVRPPRQEVRRRLPQVHRQGRQARGRPRVRPLP